MKSTKVPRSKCECGYIIDATTQDKGEAVPQEGDFSLCLNCARLKIFNKDLSLQLPTKEEFDEIKSSSAWPRIQKDQLAIYKAIKTNLVK